MTLTDYRFADSVTLTDGMRRTDDGYLVATARVARTGIQLYQGAEVGLPDRDIVRVWRPEDEVKDPASVRTYSHAPVTLGHPAQMVTPETFADVAKGEISTEAQWVDNHLAMPLIVKDAATIAAIESGIRDVSAGYICQLDHTPGTTPDGEEYDAVQRQIRINHVAIVPQGRAGSARIGDSAATWGARPLTTPPSKTEDSMSQALTTVVLGDQAVQVAADAALTIDKFKQAQAKALADAEAAHAAAIAAKDGQIGELTAKLKKAEDAIPTADALGQMVRDRAALEATVAKIDKDIKADGVSDADLRRAAVVARMGDEAVKDASPEVIAGMFRVVAADAEKGATDTLRDAASGGTKAPDNLATIYAARDAALSDAWKNQSQKQGA